MEIPGKGLGRKGQSDRWVIAAGPRDQAGPATLAAPRLCERRTMWGGVDQWQGCGIAFQQGKLADFAFIGVYLEWLLAG